MNRLLSYIFFLLFIFAPINDAHAQRLIQNDKFTQLPLLDGKAVLIKEIPLLEPLDTEKNYNKLKDWIKSNYTTDLINSSIKYNPSTKNVFVKSRVELLLPILNSQNVSEKTIMNYHLDTFILDGKCIFQVSEINYKLENAIPAINNKLKAEQFVSEQALLINDNYSKERAETYKGTLYYFNNLADSLTEALHKTAKN